MAIIFSEGFENSSFSARDWYDGTDATVDTSVFSPFGGAASLKIHFNLGGTGAAGGTPARKLFSASDRVYVQFDMKLGTAGVPWQGSGLAYHPHLMQVFTDAESGAFNAPNPCLLSVMIEPHAFIPLIQIQDGVRTNVAQVGNNLLGSPTAHAVGGSNGGQASANYTEYYDTDPPNAAYTCFTEWTKGNPQAGQGSGTPGYTNNTWHRVAAYMEMNTISGGSPLANGTLQHWVDDVLVINQTAVELRTAQYATQKFNQFALLPHIGDGSPIAQDMWIDNLVVSDSLPAAAAAGLPGPRRSMSIWNYKR